MEQLDENIRAQKKARNEEDEQLLFQLDHAFHRILAEGVNKLQWVQSVRCILVL